MGTEGRAVKTASFTVYADVRQSARWKQAAEGEGFPSVGGWLAVAADRHLQAVARAGRPIPLAWRRGSFTVRLEGGELVPVKGHVSPPFGSFAGTEEGPASYCGRHRHVLVFLADSRVIATLRSFRECKTLASDLARMWVRGDGSEPYENPAPLLQRS
jgi:hypothetical protein